MATSTENGNGNGRSFSQVSLPIAVLLSGLGAIVWAIATLWGGQLDTLRTTVERHHGEPGHPVVLGKLEAIEREFLAIRERITSSENLNAAVHAEFERRVATQEHRSLARDRDWELLRERLVGQESRCMSACHTNKGVIAAHPGMPSRPGPQAAQ